MIDTAPLRPGRLAGHAATLVGFNTLIGLGVGIAHGRWLHEMVYSQAIGISIWAMVEAGKHLWPFRRNPANDWPLGWRTPVMIAACVVLGYPLGTWIGDTCFGYSSFSDWLEAPRALLGYLILSIGLSAGISFFFFARARDRNQLHALAVAQRDIAEAKLGLLASQLEPHMLFNTLANLRVLIALDPVRAQAMLDQLIAFLRSTLDASRNGGSHSLADEFARLHDYLGLMQVRMGDRLRPRLDLPPPLANCRVPPMLLQPLVENAIKHGLEPHVDGGRLDVTATREGDQLVLRVRDTGAGLSDRPSADGTHVGLQLVRDRLAAEFAGAASFVLEPASDTEGGTLATVRLPVETTP